MENLSHSLRPAKLSRKHHSHGATASQKAIYDDVFGGPPKFAVPSTLSPRAEDYREIFGGFHAPRVSSIPVLDLPAVDEPEAFFDVRSPGFDYSEVFGGFRGLDFADGYDELFGHRRRRGSAVSGSSDEAWTPAASESLSEESDHSGSNQCLSNGDSHHSFDGDIACNISYHKANPKSDAGIMNGFRHTAEVHAVQYSYMNDQMDPHRTKEKELKKTRSDKSNGRNDVRLQRDYGRVNSCPAREFATVSEVSLRTEPSHLPPPSRPPPPASVGDISGPISSWKTGSVEGNGGDSSTSPPPFVDVEVDASSSAASAASAAAMKEAMMKAQAQLRSAKELMERKKEGRHNRARSGTSGEMKNMRGNHVSESELQGTGWLEGIEMKHSFLEEPHDVTGMVSGVQDSFGGKLQSRSKGAVLKVRDKESTYNEMFNHYDEAGEWKEATQFFELVQADRSRCNLANTEKEKNMSKNVKTYDVGEVEGMEGFHGVTFNRTKSLSQQSVPYEDYLRHAKIASAKEDEEVSDEQIFDKKERSAQEFGQWEEDRKMHKKPLQNRDTVVKINRSESSSERESLNDVLTEVAHEFEVREVMERKRHGTKSKKSSGRLDAKENLTEDRGHRASEKRPKDPIKKEEKDRKQEILIKPIGCESRCPELFGEEEHVLRVNLEYAWEEAAAREENEWKSKPELELEDNGKRMRWVFDQEEEKKLKESEVWAKNEKRVKEHLELAENERKQVAAREQQRRLKEVKEKRLREAHELAERDKLKETLEREENERKQREAREQEEKEHKGKEAIMQEEAEHKRKEALEREEERRKEVLEQEERERKRKEARQQEEKERGEKEALEEGRLKEAREQEERERQRKETLEWEEKEKRLKEALEKEECRRKEVLEQEERERKRKEALEQEERERKRKEALEKEEERRLKEALEQEEREHRRKETLEREEKRRNEALEQEERELRRKEALEQDEKERKLKEALELEEKEKMVKEALEREENEKRLYEALDKEKMQKKLEETRKREEQERILNEAREREEREEKIQEAEEACTRERVDIKSEGCYDHEEIDDAVRDTFELEELDRWLKEAVHLEEPATLNESTQNVEVDVQSDFPSSGLKQTFTEPEDAIDASDDGVSQIRSESHDSESNSSAAKDEDGGSKSSDSTESAPANLPKQVNSDSPEVSSQVSYNSKHWEGKSAQHREATKENVQKSAARFDGDGRRVETPRSAVQNAQGKSRHGQSAGQAEGRKETSNETVDAQDKQAGRVRREQELEKDWLRKIEAEKEREREREKDRMAVDRATLEARERAYAEARERAERAAFERATAEARQRSLAEARERLEKACAEARERSFSDKTSMEARIRAERAAVERATAEARERAAARYNGMRQSNLPSDVRDMQHQTSGSSSSGIYQYSSGYGATYDSEKYGGVEGESAQRSKARLERHRRTAERAAKALAEKNMRDLLAQREQAERNRLAETLDADVKRWSNGKEGNLRALLSTLQYILGADSGWQPVPLTEVITSVAVKKAYRKATLCVHPDKLQQRGASIQQKYICEKVFDLLKEAWNKFNSEER